MNTRPCHKCRHWHGAPIPPTQWGQCRRRSPQLMLCTGATEWPQVHRNDHCGEFDPRSMSQALAIAEREIHEAD